MTKLLLWPGSFTATFLGTLLAACGGKVVVDGSGNGDGGAGAGSSTSTSTSPADLCSQLCALWEQQNCPMQDCGQQCALLFQTAGSCVDELTAVLQCILDHSDEMTACDTPVSCIGFIETYGQCIMPPTVCSDEGCFAGSDGSCGCKGVCGGVTVSIECSNQSCNCFVGGGFVGSCAQTDPFCGLDTGCCAPFFAQNGQ